MIKFKYPKDIRRIIYQYAYDTDNNECDSDFIDASDISIQLGVDIATLTNDKYHMLHTIPSLIHDNKMINYYQSKLKPNEDEFIIWRLCMLINKYLPIRNSKYRKIFNDLFRQSYLFRYLVEGNNVLTSEAFGIVMESDYNDWIVDNSKYVGKIVLDSKSKSFNDMQQSRQSRQSRQSQPSRQSKKWNNNNCDNKTWVNYIVKYTSMKYNIDPMVYITCLSKSMFGNLLMLHNSTRITPLPMNRMIFNINLSTNAWFDGKILAASTLVNMNNYHNHLLMWIAHSKRWTYKKSKNPRLIFVVIIRRLSKMINARILSLDNAKLMLLELMYVGIMFKSSRRNTSNDNNKCKNIIPGRVNESFFNMLINAAVYCRNPDILNFIIFTLFSWDLLSSLKHTLIHPLLMTNHNVGINLDMKKAISHIHAVDSMSFYRDDLHLSTWLQAKANIIKVRAKTLLSLGIERKLSSIHRYLEIMNGHMHQYFPFKYTDKFRTAIDITNKEKINYATRYKGKGIISSFFNNMLCDTMFTKTIDDNCPLITIYLGCTGETIAFRRSLLYTIINHNLGTELFHSYVFCLGACILSTTPKSYKVYEQFLIGYLLRGTNHVSFANEYINYIALNVIASHVLSAINIVSSMFTNKIKYNKVYESLTKNKYIGSLTDKKKALSIYKEFRIKYLCNSRKRKLVIDCYDFPLDVVATL